MQAQLNAKSCYQIYTNHKMKCFVKFKDRTKEKKLAIIALAIHLMEYIIR